jgi:hypothetical protein
VLRKALISTRTRQTEINYSSSPGELFFEAIDQKCNDRDNKTGEQKDD